MNVVVSGRRISLDRIKTVKHPFLLSLERYEVTDGRLTIVTELAEGSVEDLYDSALADGAKGLPIADLMRYLYETADALDYLHRDFQLQHLDIKPGNLLLVGGHVKVADFGLVKDLRDVTQSVVGGLTPVYAPPEVFDGRPSMHSDQYSLAVVYQELLTRRPTVSRQDNRTTRHPAHPLGTQPSAPAAASAADLGTGDGKRSRTAIRKLH